MTNELDDKHCPFCKKENSCMAQSTPNSCWCNEVKVPAELQKLVPIEWQHKSCICAACVTRFNQDPSAFQIKTVTK